MSKDSFFQFCQDLQAIEQRAANLGLWVTRRAINSAVVAAGWEKAEGPVMAAKKARERMKP